jgi:hypothetical protein
MKNLCAANLNSIICGEMAMRPIQKIKVHGHHVVSFETLEKIEWHLKNLPDGWQTVRDMSAKKHRKLHAKRQRGQPVKFYGALLGYRKAN